MTAQRQKADPADRLARIETGSEIASVRPGGATDTVRVRVGRGRDSTAFTIPADDADRLRLAAGVSWTPELADAIADALREDRAFRSAVLSITRAPCSRRRLIERLTAKHVGRAVAERVADRLEALGALDDASLAAGAARSVVLRGGAGRRFIESKLRARGIDSDTARRAADEALEGTDPRADARAFAVKKARSLPPKLTPDAARRRLYAALARRGFDSDTCRDATQHAVSAADAAEPDDHHPID